MPDYTPDGKPVPRQDNPPQRTGVSRAHERKTGRSGDDAVPAVATWQYSYSGKATGPGGFIAGAAILAAVVLALVLGAVAITVVLWIALSLVVIGVLVALVRRVFGMSGERRSR